jgi:hypothetical protein
MDGASDFRSENGFDSSHKTLSCPIRLKMMCGGRYMLDTKTFKLVAKRAGKLRTIITGEPLRQPITHQPEVVKGTSHCRGLLVRQEDKFGGLRKIIEDNGYIP